MSTPFLLVSVHDVAPPTARATRRWSTLLAPTGIPLTFLAVPGPWRGAGFDDQGDDGLDLAAWLRGRQEVGDEICIHGWNHRADLPGPAPRRWVGTAVARGAAEFWALDRATAATRSAHGLEVLDRHGLSVIGTTPPGWLAGAPARQGMADAGLQYCTDHAGVVDLRSRRRWSAPALCHRPVLDPAAGPADRVVERAGQHVVGSAWRLVTAGLSVRIGLHPADLDRPRLTEAALTAIRRCLEAGAVATTYGQVARRLRDSPVDAR
jgi:predicted deacetylase